MGDNAYVIGEALLVTLDSNEKNFEEKEKFLQDAIQTHQKKWVIVAMHHSIFSVGEHSDSERLKEYRTKYAKMFSNANVDLVLMGHDHTYTRTWLIQDGLPMINELGDTLQKEEQQALYVTVNSSSGSKYYDIQNIPDYAAVYNQDYSPNITKVEVDTNEIRVLTCDGNTMEIVDDVTLRK